MRRAWSRRGRFWVGYVLRHRSRLLVTPLLEPLIDRLGNRASFEGIDLVEPPQDNRASESPFVRDTVAALRLLRSVDPRRFHRVQREIATIKNTLQLSFASYGRAVRCCRIDYARADPDKWKQHPEWYAWFYAATLVHEATHGALYSRHILYTPKLRARIERLCCAEARRFATRADREDRQWSDTLVPPFDEKGWHDHWRSTWWQKTKRLTARCQEVWWDGKSKNK